MSGEQYLVGRLEEALAHEGETDVHVSVTGDRVLMTGTVSTDARLETVDGIAREVADGLTVQNHVTVMHCREPDDQERLS